MAGFLSAVLVMSCAASAIGLVALTVQQGRTDSPLRTCVVIADADSPAIWRSDRAGCQTRLAPASTFKIPHALVALETGVVTPETVERWDGVQYPGRPLWEQDHTVLSALKPSVVWFFQRIAPRIGASRMRDWLRRFEYGNARTEGDVTLYWLNGTLLISPEEQVQFLTRFYAERLPVSVERQRLVRESLVQPAGTVQNAQGVTALDGTWSTGATWSVKTGSTAYGKRSVSWLVGRLDTQGKALVFAAAAWKDERTVDPLEGARLAARALIARGFVGAK